MHKAPATPLPVRLQIDWTKVLQLVVTKLSSATERNRGPGLDAGQDIRVALASGTAH